MARYIERAGTKAEAARGLGIHQTQLDRWLEMGAVIIDGHVFTPAQKHRDARVYTRRRVK